MAKLKTVAERKAARAAAQKKAVKLISGHTQHDGKPVEGKADRLKEAAKRAKKSKR